MKILLFTNTHNELSQRAYSELIEQGHSVNVVPVISDTTIKAAVAHFQPQLIIATFLKQAIPESIQQKHNLLIIRPDSLSDRGPSSLQGNPSANFQNWRVTLLQAAKEKDSHEIIPAPAPQLLPKNKTIYYKHQVANAAVQSILETVEKLERDIRLKKDVLPLSNPQMRGRIHSIGL